MTSKHPLRFITNTYIWFSASVYIFFRLIDPGPNWLNEVIDRIVASFNLEVMQKITVTSQHVPSFWSGTGFALKLQILLGWPVMWVLAISAGWACRNGSNDLSRYSPIVKNPSFVNWIKNIIPFLPILFLSYLPFYGSDISTVKKSIGIFNVLVKDTPLTSLFWVVIGCCVIHLTAIGFFVINSELKITLNNRK